MDDVDYVILGKGLRSELGTNPERYLTRLLGGSLSDDSNEFDEIDPLEVDDRKSILEDELLALRQRTMDQLGIGHPCTTMFMELIMDFRDVFRIGLDCSPPIICDPYAPVLRPDVVPVKAKQRSYSPRQCAFLKETVDNLMKYGILKRNPKSLWSSPVFLPPKGNSFRFTVDLRKVNRCIVPRAWPMPYLDISIEKVCSKKCYASLDCDNGYFQIMNDASHQDVFTILVLDELYTSTRLL